MVKVIDSLNISTWAPRKVETKQTCVSSPGECQSVWPFDWLQLHRLWILSSKLLCAVDWAGYNPLLLKKDHWGGGLRSCLPTMHHLRCLCEVSFSADPPYERALQRHSTSSPLPRSSSYPECCTPIEPANLRSLLIYPWSICLHIRSSFYINSFWRITC